MRLCDKRKVPGFAAPQTRQNRIAAAHAWPIANLYAAIPICKAPEFFALRRGKLE